MSTPKTLLFSPINPDYLRDTAAEWKKTGFDGFLLSGIMANWADDIWALDGDSLTRDKNDETLKRILECNQACEKAGILDNYIKVAFYKHVPVWTDEQAWQQLIVNFKEAARFAKLSQCKGIALDIEYVGEQYDLDWEGYDYSDYTEDELRKAAVLRGDQLVKAMFAEYPEMVFLHLPEGLTFYGPLAGDFFVGMVNGMTEIQAPGGVHLLTERTYDMKSTFGLIHYAYSLQQTVLNVLDESARKYWKKSCSIVLGGWPLGYYRQITDEHGEFIGWSGRQETFGNEIVGSYADKSQRMSPNEFRDQYAGILLAGKKYCWIYGHGATWWQYSETDLKKYGQVSNVHLPVDKELDGFKAVLNEKWMSTSDVQRTAELVRNNQGEELMEEIGFAASFDIYGPLGCKTCNNFDTAFAPEDQYLNAEEMIDGQKINSDPTTGYLDFKKYYNPKDWVCAYALCLFTVPNKMSAQIRLGSNDTATLWFNGDKKLSKNIERAAAPDADSVPVLLMPGENSILVKVCNTEGDWGLYLRITDEQGSPLQNITYSN